MRIAFSWQRCEADGTQCATIPGQPDNSFAADHEITREDIGPRLRLQVGARTPDGTVYAYSATTGVIAP
jgi:hypothetical protein